MYMTKILDDNDDNDFVINIRRISLYFGTIVTCNHYVR